MLRLFLDSGPMMNCSSRRTPRILSIAGIPSIIPPSASNWSMACLEAASALSRSPSSACTDFGLVGSSLFSSSVSAIRARCASGSVVLNFACCSVLSTAYLAAPPAGSPRRPAAALVPSPTPELSRSSPSATFPAVVRALAAVLPVLPTLLARLPAVLRPPPNTIATSERSPTGSS